VEFYRNAFGWDPQVTSDTDEFRLTAIGADGKPAAAIMDARAYLPEGQAPHWDAYICVAGTGKALALAAEMGATIGQEPMDTPSGRLAAVADPAGALIKVIAHPNR
jgi:predicted enzyme related to lactoylglutathione lyase